MKQLGLMDLLQLAGYDPSWRAKMVRHQHARYPVRELLRNQWLELYQSYQSKPVFHKIDVVVSFFGLSRNRAGLFGVFRKRDVVSAADGPAPASCPWAKEWKGQCAYFYRLDRLSGFEAFEDRLVIDWGRGALAWHQRLSNKPVLELTPKGRRLPPFDDYLEFSLSFAELKELVLNPEAHRDWQARLEAVGGVYLILAEPSGRQYVGSATGAGGIWARWAEYARTGHAGNQLLRELIATSSQYPAKFRFSLLQILPKSVGQEEVLQWEARYKEKLGSRAIGLNAN